MTDVVGIDLARGTLLARACIGGQIELVGELNRVTRSLQAVGEDPTVVIAGYEVAQWLGTSGSAILATIAAVGGWGPPDAALSTTVLWSRLLDGASLDPTQPFAAAGQAISARDRGDDETFERLLTTWASDPVFAVTLAEHLDVEYVVDWLEAVQLARGQDSGIEGRATALDLLGSLSVVVATAAAVGAAPFSLGELIEAGESRNLDLADTAIFVQATAPWPREWLRDAMQRFVLPLCEQVAAGGAWLVDQPIGDTVFDVRAPILLAVSQDEVLSREITSTYDLALLTGGLTYYLDGGAAVAALIIAGTYPSDGLVGPQRELAFVGAQRFIESLSLESPPPPALVDAFGTIVRPYIGAFRVDSADGRTAGIVNPLPTISEIDLREYLDLAAPSLVAVTDLRQAVVVWTAVELARQGASRPSPEALHDLGSVRRFIEEGTLGYERRVAETDDIQREALRTQLSFLAEIPGMLPPTKWVGTAVSFGLGIGFDALAPSIHEEIDHLAAVPQLTGRAQEVLEWQLLAHLWRHREASGLFDVLEPPPASLIDPGGLLANPTTFTGAQWDEFKVWRDSVADATGVDNLGAAYGRDVPPTTDLSD